MSITHTPPTHVRRPHVNPWLVAVIVLGAALAGLGTWVLIDQTRSSSTQDLAAPEVAARLDARIAAMNRYDAEATAAFFSKDAVMEEIENGVLATTSNGRQEIAARFDYLLSYAKTVGLQNRTGTTTQIGPYVAQPYSWSSEGRVTNGEGFLVFRLDESGKIAHEWVIIDTR